MIVKLVSALLPEAAVGGAAGPPGKAPFAKTRSVIPPGTMFAETIAFTKHTSVNP